MTYNVIRYGVKDTSITENRALVEKVFEALDKNAAAIGALPGA